MAMVADALPVKARGLRRPRLSAGLVGAVLLAAIALPCFLTLPWSVQYYDLQRLTDEAQRQPPSFAEPMGTDTLGRPLLWRCLLGGAISLGVGLSAAVLAMVIGTAWGAVAGYVGGRVDSAMMRLVDVLYGLPYILLVVLVDMALQPTLVAAARLVFAADIATGLGRVVTLMLAIGAVSWLTMARVIRGQVLSLRGQPFIEAARAVGAGPMRLMGIHLLPNLIGPMIVYSTLTVPAAILQESFLSFLGIGIQDPLPSWGNLASDGLRALHALAMGSSNVEWWVLLFPCLLLGLTLMGLNFVGDALRERFDPRSTRA
ncbi:ABC transporter permease [Phycisphaerales bacterium AB-hyl4]|uniref:ABC transporter permease n=1 Tax=Natronomicrosphaera hydrolytica TaxID=3242702 RepID=A0ABV4U7P0_9BACT